MEAQVQFVRILDICCRQTDTRWSIMGDFIRNIFNQPGTISKSMEVFISSRRGNARDIIKDMQVMGIIKNVKTISDNHLEAYVEIVGWEKNSKFKVHFHINCFPSYDTTSDQLVLSASGLTVVATDNEHDEFNLNPGIATLQRLLEIREKTTRLVGKYINVSSVYSIRLKNARRMFFHNHYLGKGFVIKGNNNLVVNKSSCECPICYEENKYSSVLKCGHEFCLSCLSSHMEKIEDLSGNCPLCRSPIMLNIKTN
jgi:hypothetical protein